MNYEELKNIAYSGLWKKNPGIVQILGMCPTLAMTNSVVTAVSLGIATALVMAISGFSVAALRNYVPNELRNPVYILIIASAVTVVDLLMNAYLYSLYVVLGIFIPLIVTNCIVLARAEAFASKNSIVQSTWDGFMMGVGATVILGILGAIRELFGKGTLLSGIELVLGSASKHWVIHIAPADLNYQFLIILLPPGAFISLGFLIAGKAWIDKKRAAIS